MMHRYSKRFNRISRKLRSLCSCFKPFNSSETNVFICLMSIPRRFYRTHKSIIRLRQLTMAEFICHFAVKLKHAVFYTGTYIICSLEVPCLLAQKAKHIGEMLIPDFIKHLQDTVNNVLVNLTLFNLSTFSYKKENICQPYLGSSASL